MFFSKCYFSLSLLFRYTIMNKYILCSLGQYYLTMYWRMVWTTDKLRRFLQCNVLRWLRSSGTRSQKSRLQPRSQANCAQLVLAIFFTNPENKIFQFIDSIKRNFEICFPKQWSIPTIDSFSINSSLQLTEISLYFPPIFQLIFSWIRNCQNVDTSSPSHPFPSLTSQSSECAPHLSSQLPKRSSSV